MIDGEIDGGYLVPASFSAEIMAAMLPCPTCGRDMGFLVPTHWWQIQRHWRFRQRHGHWR